MARALPSAFGVITIHFPVNPAHPAIVALEMDADLDPAVTDITYEPANSLKSGVVCENPVPPVKLCAGTEYIDNRAGSMVDD